MLTFRKKQSLPVIMRKLQHSILDIMQKPKKGDGIHPLAYANMKIYGPIVAEKLNETVQSKSELVLPKSDISMGHF